MSQIAKAYAPVDPTYQLWALRVIQALRKEEEVQQAIADKCSLNHLEVKDILEFILASAEKGVTP